MDHFELGAMRRSSSKKLKMKVDPVELGFGLGFWGFRDGETLAVGVDVEVAVDAPVSELSLVPQLGLFGAERSLSTL